MHRLWLALCLLPLACATNLGGEDDCMGGDCDFGDKALCEIEVKGTGAVTVEEVYLPQVLACENPAAPPAALRAQAIAARSYLYYTIAFQGSIGDGETAQVFSCTDPSTGQPKVARREHFDAVAATSGKILKHNGHTIASFYVAGAQQQAPNCTGGTSDPTNTERLVTYNEGKAGSDVQKSSQGSLSSPNNRGTMSQNGANCLADVGLSTEQILQFYYGTDIEIFQTTGECVSQAGLVTAEDVGETCSDDSTCDSMCQTWYLPTVNQAFGMCSAECSGACPDGSACVAFGAGRHRCAPVPASGNSFCDSIPGAVPRVLEAVGGSVASVCATPALGTKCNVTGNRGECVDTNINGCDGGTLHEGACPGDGAIQCCVR